MKFEMQILCFYLVLQTLRAHFVTYNGDMDCVLLIIVSDVCLTIPVSVAQWLKC